MIEQLIRDWGYPVVALGAFVEGETVVLAAGYAARQGLLDLPSVIGIAALAATLGDQFFFWIGRIWGQRLLARWPWLHQRIGRVTGLLQRYPHGAIVAVRFIYGLRLAGPVLIGAARVSPLRFLLFNVVGALIWAPLIACLGWVFGEALSRTHEHLHRLELGLLLLLAMAALVASLSRRS